MKKTLLSVVALMGLTAATAQIYSATDSTAFAAWTTVDIDNDGFNFAAAEVNGMSCVSYSYDNASTTALTPNNLFISPVMDLSSYSGLVLTFDVTAIDQSWVAEKYAVYVVTNATDLAGLSAGNFPAAVHEETLTTGVLSKTVNISGEADGQAAAYIVIRHFDCTDNFGIGFQNVTVTDAFASVEDDSSLEVLSAYPNPTTDVLNINLNENATTVSVLSLDGKLISTENVNSNIVTLNVSDLASGVYFYEVVTAEGDKLRNKFVKK